MSNWVLLRFTRYETATAKAYLVRQDIKEIWLPKKFCRNLIINKKLGGNVQIPEWLYIDKLGIEPSEHDYTFKVTKHEPEKLSPKESNNIIDLQR